MCSNSSGCLTGLFRTALSVCFYSDSYVHKVFVFVGGGGRGYLCLK